MIFPSPFIKRLFNRFLNLPLVQKFILLFIIVLLIPVVVVSIYSFGNIKKAVVNNERYTVQQGFEQAYSFLSYRIEHILSISDIILKDQALNKIIYNESDASDSVQQLSNMREIIQRLNEFSDRTNNISPILFVKEGLAYSDQNNRLFNIAQYENQSWYKKSLQGWGWLTSCSPKELQRNDIAAITRPVHNLSNYSHVEAMLRFDISVDTVNKMLARANTVNTGFTYLENEAGDLIASSCESETPIFRLDHQAREKLVETAIPDTITLNDKRVYVLCRLIPRTDWYLVSILPEQKLTNELKLLLRQMFVMVLLLILAGILLAAPILISILKRVKQLNSHMQRVQKGDLTDSLHVDSSDEIGCMMKSYNYMLEKLSSLMKQQYELGQALKAAELKALQSQINPHFLYNTLELIGWIAVRNKANEIIPVIKAMARFYKLSLNNGKDVMTIGEELEMVSNYILIQQKRFKKRIEIIIDAEEVLKYSIPKITLQPIVENAIYHGIMEKPTKSGKIKITGRIINNSFIDIYVEDDGVGMSQKEWEAHINSNEKDTSMHGYGLKNIEMRICLFFGIEKSLSCDITTGAGTRIKIHIPAILPN